MRGPHQPSGGLFSEKGKCFDPPLVNSIFAPCNWSLSSQKGNAPHQVSILLPDKAHHCSAFVYHPKEFKWRRKGLVNSEAFSTFFPVLLHPVQHKPRDLVLRQRVLGLQPKPPDVLHTTPPSWPVAGPPDS